MLYRRLCLIGFIVLGISACSKSDQSVEDQYLTVSKATAGMTVPAGASAPKSSPYYKIPSTYPQGQTPPSIQPPVLSGTKKTAEPMTVASTASAGTVQKRATLILPEHNAWRVLGRALNDDARLKVVDQNQAKQIYYVLDTKKTSGTIKKKTPIYWVKLEPIQSGYLVVVTNDKGGAVSVETHNTIIRSLKGYML